MCSIYMWSADTMTGESIPKQSIEQIREEAARAATLAENKRVLDTMEDWLKNDKCPPKKKKGAKCDIGCGRCMINALRQQQEREHG